MIRLRCFPGNDETKILFESHHCATDAIGAYQFFKDWLTLYRALLVDGGSQAKLPKLDRQCLHDRTQIKLPLRQRLKLLSKQWHSVKGVFKFKKRRIIPLVAKSPSSGTGQGKEPPCQSLNIYTTSLTEETTQCLRARASIAGHTVNTFLIAKLYSAIQSFQGQLILNSAQGSHWRIAVPINERTMANRRMPACNHCSTVFFDRDAAEIECERSLIAGIQTQMDCIRQWKLSLNMWRYLAAVRMFGGIQRRVQGASEQCYATVILSNVGELTLRKAGKATNDLPEVKLFEPVGPLRRGTPLTITTFYFRNRLHFSFRYDERQMGRHQFRDFSDIYLNMLRTSVHQIDGLPSDHAVNATRRTHVAAESVREKSEGDTMNLLPRQTITRSEFDLSEELQLEYAALVADRYEREFGDRLSVDQILESRTRFPDPCRMRRRWKSGCWGQVVPVCRFVLGTLSWFGAYRRAIWCRFFTFRNRRDIEGGQCRRADCNLAFDISNVSLAAVPRSTGFCFNRTSEKHEALEAAD